MIKKYIATHFFESSSESDEELCELFKNSLTTSSDPSTRISTNVEEMMKSRLPIKTRTLHPKKHNRDGLQHSKGKKRNSHHLGNPTSKRKKKEGTCCCKLFP